MKVFLIFILVILIAVSVWQGALLVRDIIRKVRSKKNKSSNKDDNVADDSAKKGV